MDAVTISKRSSCRNWGHAVQFVQDRFGRLFDIPVALQIVKKLFLRRTLYFRYLFEWDNREMSAMALIAWLTFWMVFQIWMTPLLLVVPFAYYWIASQRNSKYLHTEIKQVIKLNKHQKH